MKRVVLVMLAFLLGAAFVGAADGDPPVAPAIDDPRFEFLQRLEGTWVGETGMPEAPQNVLQFRVIAGGQAIEEREFVGTPMEMLTVYHMEGGDLVATHYCVLGNRPQLTAQKRIVDDTLTFSCNGKPGNAASHDEKHVHGWSLRVDSPDTLYYSGELVKEGKVTEALAFELTRQQETTHR